MSLLDHASPQSSPQHGPVDALAHRTGFSPEAVEAMRRSVARGGGRMAQFDHRDFGGTGQWMRGGMVMIGDPSNHDLKRRIDALCDALSASLADESGHDAATGSSWQSQTMGSAGLAHALEQPTWYPASLGAPDTSGAQNDLRYAWFAPKRRLAVDRRGVVTLYDTGDHRIAGVSQQQGLAQKLTFASQLGDIDLDLLPVVEDGGPNERRGDDREVGEPIASRPPTADAASIDPFVAIEKLADLHARGILDADEFATKKSELLKRI